MRKAYFDTVNKFEPYTALYSLGATPDQVKCAVIRLLDPYVPDKSQLRELAVSVLAAEAICVGQLSSRSDWKAILDRCFEIREHAIRVNDRKSFEVIGYFEPAIREAQRSFALLTIFEICKDGLELDEFAFELFRSLGALVESNLQPYIKELYCLLTVASGKAVDPSEVAGEDFGRVCEKFERALQNTSLLSPEPWGVRVNQWRNIAQHHSYAVLGNSVVARFGKSQPPKQIVLSRAEMLGLAQELVWRLGAMKSSRAITTVNHIASLGAYLPEIELDKYNQATALAASFATQGFKLLDLQVGEEEAVAVLEDVAPSQGSERPIHCSQFVATIASRFPGLSVQVCYVANGRHSWTFGASAFDLKGVMELDKPLQGLARIVTFKKES